jgi:hypothetical protein
VYHLYESATGRLISSTSLEIEAIPEGMAVKESDKKGVWNAGTLDFDPIAPSRWVTYNDFAHRVGFGRFRAMKAASRLDSTGELPDGVEYLMSLSTVNLDDPDIARLFRSLVDAGVWEEGDIEEILG